MIASARHRGFALLMSLALVVLATVALSAIAFRSASAALHAHTDAQDLQRRWATRSINAALAGRLESLLHEAEVAGSSQPPRDPAAKPARRQRITDRRLSLDLAGITYDLVVSDEQAKLNLHRILAASRTPAGADIDLRRLLRRLEHDLREADVKLRPVTASSGEADTLRRLRSFGQVFPNASPDALVGDSPARGLTAHLTCWGDGRLNIRRASPALIEHIAEPVIGRSAVAALIAVRDKNLNHDLAALTTALTGVSDDHKARLPSLFTDESACHSLWVIARTPQRAFHSLIVTAGLQTRPADIADLADPADAPPAAVRIEAELFW